MEELILQSEYGLEEVRFRGSTGNRVSVSSRICLVPGNGGRKRRCHNLQSAVELRMRLGNSI